MVQPAPQLNVQHNFDVTYIEPRLRQILLDSALNLTKKYGCSTPAFLASLQAAKAGQAGE
ncbi:hypothetical protein [Streptomyces sp. NBC_00212]|uniref:hypothetical protein n=1 Tax=Streptomyces sp. NBC_00212 TaxID=2975684 RepID=UPI0032537AA7